MKRIIYAFGALTCLVTLPASAQVDKSVEVTQAFIPQVESATKPMMEPDMTDDAYITPDIDYAITPISIHTELDSTPYKPVEMNYWEYRRQNHYYAKVGAGYPFKSVVDLYASKNYTNSGYVMGYVNHDGDYSDIKNDYGVNSNAVSYHIGTGAAAGLYLGQRTLEGLFSYDRDYWSRYATIGSSDEHPIYQDLGFGLRFGDNFSDLSRFNISIGGSLDYMWSESGYESLTYAAKLSMAKEIGSGYIRFDSDYRGVDSDRDYSSNTFGAGLLYGIDRENVSMSAGVKYYYDSISGDVSHYILPTFSIDYDLFDRALIAYIDLDSGLDFNDFASLVDANPYVIAGVSIPESTLSYDLSLGLKGAVASEKLTYDMRVGYIWSKNNLDWAYVESYINATDSYNGYAASCSEQNYFNLSADFDYRVTPKLSFDFGYQFNNYADCDDLSWENGLAKSTLSVGGEYDFGRLSLAVGCDMLSRRYVTAIGLNSSLYSIIEIPTTFDLRVNVEYSTRGGAVIFADLNNLLNQDLYNFARYREYGVGAVVGVKFVF